MAPYIGGRPRLTGDRYHLRHMPSNQSRNNVVAFAFRRKWHAAASAAGSEARSRLTSCAPRGRLFPIPASSVTAPPPAGSRPTSRGGRVGTVGWGKVGDDVMSTRGVMKMVRGLFLRGKQDEMSFPCCVTSSSTRLPSCICCRQVFIGHSALR